MASANLNRPELVFDMDDLPLIFEPDFSNEFVAIIDTPSSLGLLPDWFGECCSDLRDDERKPEELREEDVLFPRMTGSQLSFTC